MSANDFFLSARFAVAGASSDPAKYGHKVLSWYQRHNLHVTPINPVSQSQERIAQDGVLTPFG